MHGYSFSSCFQLLQDNPSEIEGKHIANLLCSVPLTNFAVILLALLLLALPFSSLPSCPPSSFCKTLSKGKFINPRRACATRLLYLVCVSVCLSPLILTLQGPSRLISDTNGSSATKARKVMSRFCLNGGVRGVKTGDKATYLHGPLPIQAQWSSGSFTMGRRECSNGNSVSVSP